MAALAIVLVEVSGDARQGKADASLDSSLTTAAALYRQDTAISARKATKAARRLAPAVRDRSAGLPVGISRERRRLSLAELRALGPNGDVLAQAGSDGIAQRRASINGRAGQRLGTIEAAQSTAKALASEIANLTGRAVQIEIGGEVVAASEELDGAPSIGGMREVNHDGQKLRVVRASLDEPATDAHIVLAAPASIGGSELTPPVAAVGLVIFLAAALAFVTFLTRALEGQVETMLEAARRIGQGDFSHRVPVAGDDELAGLALEFNKMSGRLGEQVDEIRRQQSELEVAVHRIGELAASGLDREGLLGGIGEAAVAATAADAGLISSAAPDAEDQLVGASPSSETLAILEAAAADALAGGDGEQVRDGMHAIARSLPGSDGRPIGAMAVARFGEFDRASADVLGYLVGQATVSMENLSLHEKVAEQAVTDALTRIPNKRRFDEWLALEVGRARRFGHSLSLLILDVDDFKQVNDSRGHPAGDAVLREIGDRIAAELREVDLPARYGGEEFAVGLTETDAEGARFAAERIRSAISKLEIEDPGGGDPLRVTVSIGTATLPDAATEPEELFAAADAALYEAKRAGKNQVSVASG